MKQEWIPKNGQELLDVFADEMEGQGRFSPLELLEQFGVTSMDVDDDEHCPEETCWGWDDETKHLWKLKIQISYESESGGGFSDENDDLETTGGDVSLILTEGKETEGEISFRKWIEEKFPEEFKKITTPD